MIDLIISLDFFPPGAVPAAFLRLEPDHSSYES
jgi:hypothetical protein